MIQHNDEAKASTEPNSDEALAQDSPAASNETPAAETTEDSANAAPEAPTTAVEEKAPSAGMATEMTAEMATDESADDAKAEKAVASAETPEVPTGDGATAEVKAETKTERNAETKAKAKTATKAKAKAETTAEADAETTVEADAETTVEAKAETTAEAKTEAIADAIADEEAPPSPEVAAALASAAAPERTVKKGQRLKVRLVQIGDTDSFVDYGGRAEGVIATSELKNEKGELKHEIGSEINAVVKSADEPVNFTMGRRRVPANMGKVKEAHEAQIPILGKIKSTNKGGFEVDLSGVRAFCPFSQIQLGYCDKPEEYVGQKIPFQVVTFERGGRNIVLSRRNLLEAESKSAAKETREKLELGTIFEGTVRRLQPYGAFVDIGGIDGLVHVSEISHRRINDPAEALEIGQAVKVKIIRIEGSGDKERISLSIRQTEGDPWDEIEEQIKAGTTTKGKVVRLAEFGAFIELMPGVDGLVHISEISEERLNHPGDALEKGQEVEARVLSVDRSTRRISLSLREEGAERHDSHRGPRGARDSQAREHRSTPREAEANQVDVTQMSYEDALEALNKKFRGSV